MYQSIILIDIIFFYVQLTVHVNLSLERIMDVIPYTKARATLAKTMEQVCDDHTPITITRRNKPAVVMVSLEDYQAMDETAYLLRSPKNAVLLVDSVAELESGGGINKELLE